VSASIEIESQGEHQYVVRLRDGEQVGESWFSVTPGVLHEVSATSGDEESVVRRTAEFLAARQDVVDYPAVVELEDVIATYDDYVAFITG
jgi:hypothetical protein